MTPEPNNAPDADQIDLALQSFWQGSPDAFDRLVDAEDSEHEVCHALADVVREANLESSPADGVPGYDVLRRIGRGGMGFVYEAVQTSTGRRVAIKITPAWHVEDDSHRRLLRREVASLARLKHPNIAALYDAGQTPAGHHYFAMELVEGASLHQHLDVRPDAPAISASVHVRRLQLFLDICGAITYAHQRGVIHCDLKPSNILVGSDGTAKVLDFGLARLQDPDIALISNVSETGKIIGTLAYMSPEQAAGRSQDVDVRSDVYALGVILFELLAGRPPYETRRAPLPEALHNVMEAAPLRLGAIHPSFRGDLETIVTKALSKEPERRYQSVYALAEDIRRFLDHRPVLARPPSTTYQLSKWVRRHKLAAGLGAALLLLTTAGAAVFAVQAHVIAQERDRARRQADRAETARAFLQDMLSAASPLEAGPSTPIRELLDKAASQIDAEFADDPITQASLHETIGRSYYSLRMIDKADAHLTRNLEICRGHFGTEHPRYAAALSHWGIIQSAAGARDIGYGAIQTAYKLRKKLLGDAHPDVADSLLHVAEMRTHTGDFEAAESCQRQAIAIYRSSPDCKRELALALEELGRLLVATGRYDDGQPVVEESIAIRRRILGPDHFEIARTLADLGEIHLRNNDLKQAEASYREQIRILSQIFDTYPSKDLAIAMSDLAILLDRLGRFEEAERYFIESVEMEDAAIPGEGALSKNNYAAFLRDQGRFVEAAALFEDVYRNWHRPLMHRMSPLGGAYAAQNLGMTVLELGQLQEAERHLQDAVKRWSMHFDEDHAALAKALTGMGRLRCVQGDRAAAEAAFRKAVEIRRKQLGATNPRIATSLVNLAAVLDTARGDEAEALLNKALGLLRTSLGPDTPQEAWALTQLAALRRHRGRTGEAMRLFDQAIAIERSLPRTDHPHLANALVGLACCHLASGGPEAAETILHEAIAIRQAAYPIDDPRIAAARLCLVCCHLASGQVATANALLDEATADLSAEHPASTLLEASTQALRARIELKRSTDLDASDGLYRPDDAACPPCAEPFVPDRYGLWS